MYKSSWIGRSLIPEPIKFPALVQSPTRIGKWRMQSTKDEDAESQGGDGGGDWTASTVNNSCRETNSVQRT
jgi:hypothetical protein